jgi:CelD/BcsL family acetyltransferase involved in cellulose biosynthesis
MKVETWLLESVVEEWDRIADEVGATPFVRPGWIRSWWHAFGRGSIRVLVVRDGNRLAGVLPLVRHGSALRSPTNSETPIFGLLTESDDAARQLAATLLAFRTHRLDLSFLDLGDPGIHVLMEEAVARGFRTIKQPVLLSAYVDTRGSWSAYQATLGAKLKSEIQRRKRRLQELGNVTLEVEDGSERLETLLSEGFRIEQSGWKEAYGTAINSNPSRQRFYREIARWASERGWLRLAFLRLNRHPIAFDLCLETNGVHFLLKTGYDHAYHTFGPGKILRSMMLERAFTESINTYEFLGTVIGASNRWKLDWTDRYHAMMRFLAFPPSLEGSLEWHAFKHGARVSEHARALGGRLLGAWGRDLVKRGRGLMRRLPSR